MNNKKQGRDLSARSSFTHRDRCPRYNEQMAKSARKKNGGPDMGDRTDYDKARRMERRPFWTHELEPLDFVFVALLVVSLLLRKSP
jgi:hypothetical protein